MSFVAFSEVLISMMFDPTVMAMVLLGTLIGMLFGALPGLGGVSAIALLIPFTFGMDTIAAFALFAAAKGGGTFAGSITAIVLNIPGTPSNTASLLDGHPLARQGKAGTAIGVSAMASATGAVIGVILFLLLIPLLRDLVLMFGPPEFFVLTIIGILSITAAIRGAVLSGLAGATVGFILSFYGFNPITGGVRYTYGNELLYTGLPLVPIIIGTFAIAESFKLLGTEGTIAAESVEIRGGKMAGVRLVVGRKLLVLQSAMIGFLVGAIPGVGGSVAGFVSYMQAMNTSDDPGSFGTGNTDGLLASESANDSKDTGDLVPTLALGIPGSASAAVLLGAFILHGVRPGPRFLIDEIELAYVIFAAIGMSNILTSVIGLSIADKIAMVSRIRSSTIGLLVMAVALPAAFAIRNQPLDILIAFGIGIVGFLFIIANISRIAFIIAFLLGPLAERQFHQALQLSRGDYAIFFHPEMSPVAFVMIVGFLLVISVSYLRNRN